MHPRVLDQVHLAARADRLDHVARQPRGAAGWHLRPGAAPRRAATTPRVPVERPDGPAATLHRRPRGSSEHEVLPGDVGQGAQRVAGQLDPHHGRRERPDRQHLEVHPGRAHPGREGDAVVEVVRGIGHPRHGTSGPWSPQGRASGPGRSTHPRGCLVVTGRCTGAARGGAMTASTARAVVIGVDGSPGSESALRWGLDLATREHAPVRLVHAFEPSMHDMRIGGHLRRRHPHHGHRPCAGAAGHGGGQGPCRPP